MMNTKERLQLVIECIAETDRLRKRLCLYREELKDKGDWYSLSSTKNASVKRASIDHAKLLRELRR